MRARGALRVALRAHDEIVFPILSDAMPLTEQLGNLLRNVWNEVPGSRLNGERPERCSAGEPFHRACGIGGGVIELGENFSAQLIFAVAIINTASVTIAPIVIVSPVSPSKKKL